MFLNCFKGFKINFQNRKQNYLNRKWNYFSHFHASDQKTYFVRCFSFDPRGSKLIFKTENGIIQTGNGIISPPSRPLIKKLILQIVLICSKGFKMDFQNRKWNYPNRNWNYFSSFKGSNQKISFTKYFSFVPRDSKLIFKTGNGIIQTGNKTFLPISCV